MKARWLPIKVNWWPEPGPEASRCQPIIANEGQITAVEGHMIVNKGQMTANEGQMTDNDGKIIANKGQR